MDSTHMRSQFTVGWFEEQGTMICQWVGTISTDDNDHSHVSWTVFHGLHPMIPSWFRRGCLQHGDGIRPAGPPVRMSGYPVHDAGHSSVPASVGALLNSAQGSIQPESPYGNIMAVQRSSGEVDTSLILYKGVANLDWNISNNTQQLNPSATLFL
jgi:hypothetical protein